MDQSELHPQGDFGATFVDSGGGQPPFSALDLVEATDRAMSIETSAVDDQSYAPFWAQMSMFATNTTGWKLGIGHADFP